MINYFRKFIRSEIVRFTVFFYIAGILFASVFVSFIMTSDMEKREKMCKSFHIVDVIILIRPVSCFLSKEIK